MSAKQNDFLEGFLKGLYQSGVGNPEVQRENQKNVEDRNAALTAKMAENGMTPNKLPPDHPIAQKVGGFISSLFGGASTPSLSASSFAPDKTQPQYTMADTGQVTMLPPGTPIPAGAKRLPPKTGESTLASQYKATPFESKNVLLDGSPAVLNYNPRDASYTDTKGNKVNGKIEPLSSTAFEAGVTPEEKAQLAPLAKAIYEGRAKPGDLLSARGPMKLKLSQVLAEQYPNFDMSMAGQRAETRKDFSSAGKTGQTLTSLNTALGHLDSLAENGTSLNNKDLQIWNRVKNGITRQTGSPAVDKMLADRDAVTSELTKVFQGTGVVTDSERQEFRARMSEASSPQQIKSVSDEWINLLKSRTDAIKSNWDQSMPGIQTPVPILNDKSRKVLIKRGYDPETMQKISNSQSRTSGTSSVPTINSQAEYDALPSGSEYLDSTGKRARKQ